MGHVVGLVCRIAEADAGEGVIGEVFQAVAGAFEGVDVGVVDDAVDHGGGDGLVAGVPPILCPHSQASHRKADTP